MIEKLKVAQVILLVLFIVPAVHPIDCKDCLVVLLRPQDASEPLHIGFDSTFLKIKETYGLFSPQSVQLAYEVHSAMKKETSPSVIVIYERIKSSFPNIIRSIVWTGKVKLRNVLFNEFLYSPTDSYAYDYARRHIFTWKEPSYQGDDSSAHWKFETDDGIKFRIKNVRSNEYLYAAVQNYDGDRRHVFTWRPKDDGNVKWNIEVVSEDRIILRYPGYHNEYLFASEKMYSDKRRYIFTWRPQDAAQKSPKSDGWWDVIPV